MHALYAEMVSLTLSLRYAGKCGVSDVYVRYSRCKYILPDVAYFRGLTFSFLKCIVGFLPC